MSASMLCRASNALSKLENSVGVLLSRLFPPGGPDFALAGVCTPTCQQPRILPSFKEIWEDALLRGVPKSRRTVEKRMQRRFGIQDRVWKMMFLKKNLLPCIQCGNFHEPGLLCPHCYHKVINETKEISAKIEATLKLEPIEKDVIVLYEHDKPDPEFLENKRVVEMEKPRPAWFASNLMETSTQGANADAKELKPNDVA